VGIIKNARQFNESAIAEEGMCSLCRSMQKKAMMLLVVLGEVDLKEEERGRRGSAGSYLLSMSRMMSTDTSS
jgi:hypothetical protein